MADSSDRRRRLTGSGTGSAPVGGRWWGKTALECRPHAVQPGRPKAGRQRYLLDWHCLRWGGSSVPCDQQTAGKSYGLPKCNATGIVRRVDDLGRLLFQKKLEEPSKSVKATPHIQHLHPRSNLLERSRISTYGAEIEDYANSKRRREYSRRRYIYFVKTRSSSFCSPFSLNLLRFNLLGVILILIPNKILSSHKNMKITKMGIAQ